MVSRTVTKILAKPAILAELLKFMLLDSGEVL
jgi:hypothetical protein